MNLKKGLSATGGFIKKHWAKIGCGLLVTSTIVTSLGWAGIFEKAETAEIEDGYYDILHTLNQQHNHKVVDIVDVTTSTKTVTEGDAEVEKGVVKVLATAETSKGKKYVGSFSFTGDKETTESISTQSNELYSNVADSKIDEDNSKLIEQIITYVNSVADFVETYKDTCEFVQEDANIVALQEVITAEDNTTSTVNYSNAGLLERYYDFLGQKGISGKEEQDKFYNNVKPHLENSNFTTSIKVDIDTQTAIIFTDLKNLTFRLTLDVSAAIKSTETDEINKEVSEYVLNFLKASTNEAYSSLSIIKSADTIDISSNTIWTSINELTKTSLAAAENSLEQ